MRSFKPVTLLLFFALAWTSHARSQAPDVKSDLAGNAALQYWQAFSQMPTLDKKQRMLLIPGSAVSVDKPEVEKLVASSRASLMYLHRGAKEPRCDWGLEYDDGLSLLLPHLAKARDLALLAALHGQYEYERGNKNALRDDATAIMAVGRHVGRDPIMICVLTRYVIEDIAIDLVAPYVPEMKAPYAQAVAMFDALPPAPGFAQSIEAEKKYFVEWMIKRLKHVERAKPGAWQSEWKSFFGPGEMGTAAQAAAKVLTFEEAIKLTEALLPLYNELQEIVSLPKDEFDAKYRAFKEKAAANNSLADLILPAVEKVLPKEHRNQARFAMLLAAIAVAQEGPQKLKEIKDPFGTGPFEYRALDGGFELKSKLQFEGQPVTLTVGQRKK